MGKEPRVAYCNWFRFWVLLLLLVFVFFFGESLESRSRETGIRRLYFSLPFLHLSAVDMAGYDGLAMD
jgi:hypothetical protein